MKKYFFLAFLFVPALCLGSGKSSADKMFDTMNFKSASWKQKTVTVSDEGTDTVEQSVYYKNRKLASEGFMKGSDGEKTEIRVITTPKETIMIDIKKKEAMRVGQESDFNPDKMTLEIYNHRDRAKKTGSEKVNGVNCDIYEYAFSTNAGAEINFKAKEWREKGSGFTIRSVTTSAPYTVRIMGLEKKVGKTTSTTDVLNLKKNVSVDDSKFTVPPGVKIQDMGSIKGVMGQAKPASAKTGGKKTSPEEEYEEGGEVDLKAAEEMMKNMMKGMSGQ